MESFADAVGVLENAPDFDLFPEGWNDVSTVSEAAATSPTPVTPPAKKRRLSLSLKKGGGRGGPLTEISNQRFVSPVKEKEFNAAAKGVVPSNTKQCNRGPVVSTNRGRSKETRGRAVRRRCQRIFWSATTESSFASLCPKYAYIQWSE